MRKFFWGVALLAQLAAGAILLLTVLGAKGAPQEAAGAAMAAVVSIAPYCFARAVDELGRKA